MEDRDRKLPQHIAIILDGNGRWAKAKGRPRSYGHLVGSENVEKMCNVICDMGVRYLTVYAFSTENWKRSAEEVSGLMNVFRRYLKRCEKNAKKRSMRVRIIGDKSGMPEDIQEQIRHLEEMSSVYDRMYLQIALNYGGRDELCRAVKKTAEKVKAGVLQPEEITEDVISGELDTAGLPDPDLLIRTGGEQRISNYLLWQLAYTEFYFTDVPWPAFDEAELDAAIDYYNGRDRRFGAAPAEEKKA